MICPACDGQPGSGAWWPVAAPLTRRTVLVCDEWCAYTMRERWGAMERTHEALESAAKKLVLEQVQQNPYLLQMLAQQMLAQQTWVRQLGLGPVTFGEKIP